MNLNIPKQIAALHEMDLASLREQWESLYGKPAPTYNKVYLVKRLAYRIQELAYGGLPESTRQHLDDILEASDQDANGGLMGKHRSKGRNDNQPAVGTQFVRDWRGKRCVVTVLADGFEYEDHVYRSLSGVAKAITGTNWNGPAFFGLRRKKE